jgi:hypothetical protein
MFNIKYVYELVDKISPSIDKINSNLQNAKSRIGSTSRSIGKQMALLSVPTSLLFKKFVDSASDYNESINKVDVAFGNFSNNVKKFAETAGKNFGIDRGTALDMSAMFGDMSTGMGLSQQKASELSTSLVGLAGDLASFKNMQLNEVQTALSGVFTGETESLKRLGIVMTETNLQQFALTNGINKKISALTQGEKVLLRYNYVVAMSKNSLGDFARTSEGFANQQRILGSRFKDLSITLGTLLLPYAIKIINALIQLIEKFQSLSTETQKTILVIGGIAVVLSPLLIGLGLMVNGVIALKVALIGVAMAFKAISLAIISNPMIAFISAVIVAVIYFRKELTATFNYLSEKIDQAISWFSSLNDKIGDLLGNNTLTVKNENINSSQSKIGGRLDINFANAPKGTGIQMTPIKGNSLDIGVNSIFSGAY